MNFVSGISASLDEARKGMGSIDRVFSESVPRETRRHPLAPGVPVRELVQGALCSFDECANITPFDASRPFGGFVLKLFEDRGTKVAVTSRGAVLLKVEGLLAGSIGKPVHALPGGRFGLQDGVEMGLVLAIESLERNTAVVGVKRADDARPFIMSGRLVERI